MLADAAGAHLLAKSCLLEQARLVRAWWGAIPSWLVGVALICVYLVSIGGCAVASEAIHHEIMGLRAAGKPVVVSMGDYATSGGYLISGQPSSHVSSLPMTKHSLPLSLAACKDTPEPWLSHNSISMITCFISTQRVLLGLIADAWL